MISLTLSTFFMKDFAFLSLILVPLSHPFLLLCYLVPIDEASRNAEASFTTDKSSFVSGISAIDDCLDLLVGP